MKVLIADDEARLDRIFPLVSIEDSSAGTWAELPSKLEDVAAFKRNVTMYLRTPQAGEQILEMGAPARPVVACPQLLEQTRVAQSIEHGYDPLMRRQIARLVLAHVQVESGACAEAG
jgi:hypothetical protein